MAAMERISLFGTLFYVSLGLAVLGLGLAVFFFFFFDIPSVFALMTGRAKQQTIQRMAEQNARTGNLRSSITGRPGNSGKLGRSEKLSGGRSAVVTPPSQVMTADMQPPPMSRTEQVGAATMETAAMRQEAAGATTVLPRMEETAGETALLQHTPGFRFDVTESTLVIHTTEII